MRREKINYIYENCYAYMCNVAARYVRKKCDVEDIVQDAIVKIIIHIDRIDISDKKRLCYFCGTIVRNRAIDFCRRKKLDLPDSLDTVKTEESSVGNPETAIIDSEAYVSLFETIRSLDPIYRDVCVLKYADGYSEKEIAALLGVSVKTVYTRLLRGRKKLKAALNKK